VGVSCRWSMERFAIRGCETGAVVKMQPTNGDVPRA